MSGDKKITYPHFDPVTLTYQARPDAEVQRVLRVDRPVSAQLQSRFGFTITGKDLKLTMEKGPPVTMTYESTEQRDKEHAVGRVTSKLRSSARVGEWTRIDGKLQPKVLNQKTETYESAPYLLGEEQYRDYCVRASQELTRKERDYKQGRRQDKIQAKKDVFGATYSSYGIFTFSEFAEQRLPFLVLGASADAKGIDEAVQALPELMKLNGGKPLDLSDSSTVGKVRKAFFNEEGQFQYNQEKVMSSFGPGSQQQPAAKRAILNVVDLPERDPEDFILVGDDVIQAIKGAPKALVNGTAYYFIRSVNAEGRPIIKPQQLFREDAQEAGITDSDLSNLRTYDKGQMQAALRDARETMKEKQAAPAQAGEPETEPGARPGEPDTAPDLEPEGQQEGATEPDKSPQDYKKDTSNWLQSTEAAWRGILSAKDSKDIKEAVGQFASTGATSPEGGQTWAARTARTAAGTEGPSR